MNSDLLTLTMLILTICLVIKIRNKSIIIKTYKNTIEKFSCMVWLFLIIDNLSSLIINIVSLNITYSILLENFISLSIALGCYIVLGNVTLINNFFIIYKNNMYLKPKMSIENNTLNLIRKNKTIQIPLEDSHNLSKLKTVF